MAKIVDHAQRSDSKTKTSSRRRGERRPAGLRHVIGLAGKPLADARERDKLRHAVRRPPPLRERLAARVKQETRRLEPPKDTTPGALIVGGLRKLRDSILPNDPIDTERREQSGEPVVALVGGVDLIMLLVIWILLIAGTVMIFSSSQAFAAQNDLSYTYYLFQQLRWLVVGIIGMYFAMRIDYRFWRRLAGPGLIVGAALMILLHTSHGRSINGSLRWLQLGPIGGEPSEVVKISLVLYASSWFAFQPERLRHSLRGLLPFGAVIGAFLWLVFREPDLGTTIVLIVALLTVYITASPRPHHLALLAFAGAIGFKLLQHRLLGYQVVRLQAFLNPWHYQYGAGYQYVQSLRALGSGGVTGVGLGSGNFKYTLPEPFTDTIYAIIGEELGLIGTVGILLLFIVFAVRGMRASILAPDPFGRLLAAGLTGTVVFQAMLNMAVVAKVVPFTGVPLPFISFGGTSLSISMFAAGILLNVSKQAISLQEVRTTASTYLWWRNRRPSLPVAGRRGTPTPAPVAGRSTIAGIKRTVASIRRPAGR